MAYIIAEPCIGTKDTACIDLCPVDCIHPAKGRTYDDGRPTFDDSLRLRAVANLSILGRWDPAFQRQITASPFVPRMRPQSDLPVLNS